MNIQFFQDCQSFRLDTSNTSYVISIVDEEKFIGHAYYGAKVRDDDLREWLRIYEPPFLPSQNKREATAFMDCFPMEFAGNGLGDARESAIAVKDSNGNAVVNFSYDSHRIYAGKPKLKGLPATFGSESECMTLELIGYDKVLGLKMTLLYSVFADSDAIARSVQITNESNQPIFLTKLMSACVDMDQKDYQLLTLHGAWARERHIDSRAIGYGKQSVGSIRGESSHYEHPFLALVSERATQENGEVYGFQFVYSGNFLAQVEKNTFDSLRVMMGIHPQNFCFELKARETFVAPEVVMVYSQQGLGGMTRTYHDLYRKHLIRSPYKNKKRPILINNWEATYFAFDTEKLLSIAREAKKSGIEMLVMDDGWFGKRNDDSTSLGDWQVNEEKLKGGLGYLVEKVNEIGLQFGIWFEPEMVSPDSDLYRKHPDWAIAVPNRTARLSRNQYVLDLSRKEVADYMYECVAKVLRSANIAYVKWDMNRQFSDFGSSCLGKENQGELCHRYMLAVYQMQEKLITEFPNLLLENCSGGGGRFDAGMLYYSPQIWCSDDADAVERLAIQEGTALLYPLSTIGAHVADCPNHTVGRTTPFETRGHVALAGTFGYELDITKIAKEEREMIPKQVAMYHRYNDLVREGDYYRLASYQQNHWYDAYMVVAKDKSEALLTLVQVLHQPNHKSYRIALAGLEPNKKYRLEDGRCYYGDTWINLGLQVPMMWGDFQSKLFHFVAE